MTTKEKIIAELIHCDRIGIDISHSFNVFSDQTKHVAGIRVKFLPIAALTSVVEAKGLTDQLCQDLISVSARLAQIASEADVSVVVEAFNELPDHVNLKL